MRKRLENKIKVGKLRVKAELQIVTPAIDLIERMYELSILVNALTDMAVLPEGILASQVLYNLPPHSDTTSMNLGNE